MGESVNVAGVLHFIVEENTLIARIQERSASSGRTDDNMETLRKRLAQYKTEQLPIIERYNAQGIVKEINGLQEVEAVFTDVKQALTGYI